MEYENNAIQEKDPDALEIIWYLYNRLFLEEVTKMVEELPKEILKKLFDHQSDNIRKLPRFSKAQFQSLHSVCGVCTTPMYI